MKTAICAIIKDEQRFLKEWIDWHLNLGFDAIHLFEDKGSESHEEIVKDYSNVFLRRYEDVNAIANNLIDLDTSNRQTNLYNWFGNTYHNVYDWVAFIDIDEFINFGNQYNLEKLCDEFDPYPGVVLNWRMMGASGHIKRPDCGVVQAYTQEEVAVEKDKSFFWKSFCNLSKWRGIEKVHDAIGAVNTNHNEDWSEWRYDKAWINHYFTKSWEDWCDRIYKRGDVNTGHRRLIDFFEANPSMEYLKKELLNKVSHLIPRGTYFLDRKGTIAGGNIEIIKSLNKTTYDRNLLHSNIKL